MRHYIFCIFLLTAIGTQAQQVNPVPDYVFRNQMSVGRNAVTDTAAYMSIGPRYGANKGLMPPIVSDTAAITGVKRNGLLIFSVQRNNFQYWDSINSRWTSITANVDTTVISTRAWRKKGDDSLGAVIATRTDTTLLSTRAWRQKGLDSLAAIELNVADTATMLNPYTRGSGTVNYVPKFTTTRAFGNSQIFDNGTNVGFGTTSPAYKYDFQASGLNVMRLKGGSANSEGSAYFITRAATTNTLFAVGDRGSIFGGKTDSLVSIYTDAGIPLTFDVAGNNRLRIFANGRVGINTTTDAGYQFDVAGSIRNTTGANFATSGGDVGIGTATPANYTGLNSLTINGTNGGLIDFQNGGSRVGTIFATTTQARFGGVQKIPVELISNNAVGFLMDTARNVGINLTSGISERLDVNGRIRARTIDSTSSPINVLTSDVNGVIRKTAPGVQGSGTTNYLPKFTGTTTLGNSVAFDNGSEILINTTSDAGDFRLQVNGNANFRDDVLIDTNLRVNRHISLDQTPKAWALGNAIEGPQGSTLFVAGGGVQTLANIYYDGSYKYSTSNPGAAMFLLQSGITFATYGSGTANGALTGANEMVYAGGELRVGLADQGTFKLQVADKSYFGDEVQIASTSDLGNYKLQVTGEAIITGGIRTDAPTGGGTAATWKLGSKIATSVQLDTANYIEVEVGGTFYRLAIVTPL